MSNPLLKIQNLSKKYSNTIGFSAWKKEEKYALKNVSLAIKKGEVFALVGESGSGKTTLGKCILKFTQPDTGSIFFDGNDFTQLNEKNTRPFRNKLQMIFQNPQQALNPKQTVGSCILEVLKTHENNSKKKNYERLLELLQLVHLNENFILKYPFELSGGQQQRLVIARALATKPIFIVADEPTSCLDAIIKIQIIDLFKELQKKFNLTILFISHDLAIVSKIANRIGVMYKGELVEQAPQKDLYNSPSHPYTQLLLSSARIEGFRQNRFTPLQPMFEENNGCNFSDRCPMKQQICFSTIPELKEINPGHQVRCHGAFKKCKKKSTGLVQMMDV